MTKIALKLSEWFKQNSRELPWRSEPTPYRVWVSEIMLQQTQVATVLPYFERFMTAFPTVTHLAEASIDEVYRLWAGLGYYSRARNLHRGAQFIVQNGFPANREQWLAVTGVGDYTAGAICSIALKQREPIVDGNVVRVISRLNRIKKTDSKRTIIWKHADDLVKIAKAGKKKIEPDILNQALMELGALICKPKKPQCDTCPVSEECKGKSNPLAYPAPKPPKNVTKLAETKWVLLQGGKVFLTQNLRAATGKSWREGLWDFPNALQGAAGKFKLRKEFSLNYVVTTHKIKRLHRVFDLSGKFKTPTGRWFDLQELPGVPAPVKKALLSIAK